MLALLGEREHRTLELLQAQRLSSRKPQVTNIKGGEACGDEELTQNLPPPDAQPSHTITASPSPSPWVIAGYPR